MDGAQRQYTEMAQNTERSRFEDTTNGRLHPRQKRNVSYLNKIIYLPIIKQKGDKLAAMLQEKKGDSGQTFNVDGMFFSSFFSFFILLLMKEKKVKTDTTSDISEKENHSYTGLPHEACFE